MYGNKSELRSALKSKMMAIKLKATNSPEREIELWDKVQTISSRIRSAGAISMLEADHEYVSIIFDLLSPEQKTEWARKGSNEWTVFYDYLEKLYDTALSVRVMMNIKKSLTTGDNNPKSKDEIVCNSCKKPGHRWKDCPKQKNSGKALTATVQANEKCPLCKQDQHTYHNTLQNKDLPSRRLSLCPKYVAATDQDKVMLFKQILVQFKEKGACIWTPEH